MSQKCHLAIHALPIRLITVRFWLLMLLIATAGCDGSIGVRGRVLDVGGVPVTSGDVHLSRPGDAAGFHTELDKRGCFDLGGLVAPGQRDYFLAISSSGYEPLEDTVQSTGDYAVLARLAQVGAAEKSSLTLLPDERPKELERCFSKTVQPQVGDSRRATGVAFRAVSQWQCTNDLEVQCADGECNVETGDGFTPMSVIADDSGAMSVCAYSGCWEGSAEVLESAQFLVLIGKELKFSTSPDLKSANEDIIVSLDRTNGIGTFMAGEFVHPLLCEYVEITR